VQADQLSKRPLLSIVIPALNEGRRLPISLPKIDAFLSQQPYQAEVIVVENGSVDNTVEVVHQFAKDHPYVQVIAGVPRGKGRAVRRGMLEARGEYRFICDADLSMPIEELARFLPPQLDHYDVAIGTREGKGAHRYNEPAYRHLMGRISNFMVKLIAVRGFEDTQCGFKSFHYKAAEDIFSVARINGIGFDIELLYIAQKRGYKIVEVPIDWYFDPDSRMRMVDDSIDIFREMIDIRRNWNKGLYKKHSPSG
jgi:dolichyl-phosphate beta-glucosyltransferase